MTPVDALRMALEKENNSIRLFSELANNHAAIRELLTSLLNEEEKHKLLIEKKIIELMRG